MKLKYVFPLLPVLLLMFASCNIEDLGNKNVLDADEVFPVQIADMTETLDDMDIISMEPFYLEPEFTKMDDPDRYEYEWYVIRFESDSRYHRRHLADTRILDLEALPLSSGSCWLYLAVTDPKLGVTKVSKAFFINIQSSNISTGIYILKENDGNCEVDYHKMANAQAAGEELDYYPNLLANVLKDEIPGKPRDIRMYMGSYWWEQFAEDGTSSTSRLTNAWFIQSDQDMVAISPDFETLYKRFDGHFVTMESVVNPQGLFQGAWLNSNFYFINNYQIYGISMNMQNVGRFVRAEIAGGVEIAPIGALAGDWYSMAYDKKHSRFIYFMSFNGAISVANVPNTVTNYELVQNKLIEPYAILEGGGQPVAYNYMRGMTLFKHKTDANAFYMGKSNANGTSPFTWIHKVDAEADITKQPYPIMSSSNVGDVIYYAKGSDLWMYMDRGEGNEFLPLAQRQKKVATLGSGETIVQIEPLYSGAALSGYAWITVLTNTTDGKYKFYAFETMDSTPELRTTPGLLLTGEGKAVHQYSFISKD